MEHIYENIIKNSDENNEELYCFRSISAISFVDNNLSHGDRKEYLDHIEQCPICTKYVDSLRRDFSDIEKIVSKVFQNNFSGDSDYRQKVASLVNRLEDKRRSRFFKNFFKKIYQSFITKLK